MSLKTRPKQEDFYTPAQVAVILQVTYTTVQNWIRQERICAYKVGPKLIRISRAEFNRFIQAETVRSLHGKAS